MRLKIFFYLVGNIVRNYLKDLTSSLWNFEIYLEKELSTIRKSLNSKELIKNMEFDKFIENLERKYQKANYLIAKNNPFL